MFTVNELSPFPFVQAVPPASFDGSQDKATISNVNSKAQNAQNHPAFIKSFKDFEQYVPAALMPIQIALTVLLIACIVISGGPLPLVAVIILMSVFHIYMSGVCINRALTTRFNVNLIDKLQNDKVKNLLKRILLA